MANAKAAPIRAVNTLVWVRKPGPMALVAMRNMAPRIAVRRVADFAATVVVLPEAVSGAVPEDEWLITCALPFVTYVIDGCDVEHCMRLFNNQ
ncbi:hypothetical protein GCM10010980_09270 [Corynebacterium marinum]|nr:hypothetical protein GCM10010980_09270 [Corynebacterium marinum]